MADQASKEFRPSAKTTRGSGCPLYGLPNCPDWTFGCRPTEIRQKYEERPVCMPWSRHNDEAVRQVPEHVRMLIAKRVILLEAVIGILAPCNKSFCHGLRYEIQELVLHLRSGVSSPPLSHANNSRYSGVAVISLVIMIVCIIC